MTRTPTDEVVAAAFGFTKDAQPRPKPEPDKPEPDKPEPPSLAQALYPHLRHNEDKQPLRYWGNPITMHEGGSKMFNPKETKS